MKETSKAQRRRCKETSEGKFDWDKIFKGDGIDVGSGDDPLPNALAFDLPDGGGDDLTKFFSRGNYDYIHASNVLEHAISPEVMLRSWIECLKPGGYIVATVPDWELYEKKIWPSKWNAGHRSIWTMSIAFASALVIPTIVIKLPNWLNQFGCEILLCRLIDTSDHSLPKDVDQTLDADKGVECFIEFVLQKKP